MIQDHGFREWAPGLLLRTKAPPESMLLLVNVLLLVIVFSLSSIPLILALNHIHSMKEAIISIQFDAQVVALMTITILGSRAAHHRLHSPSDSRSMRACIQMLVLGGRKFRR